MHTYLESYNAIHMKRNHSTLAKYLKVIHSYDRPSFGISSSFTMRVYYFKFLNSIKFFRTIWDLLLNKYRIYNSYHAN